MQTVLSFSYITLFIISLCYIVAINNITCRGNVRTLFDILDGFLENGFQMNILFCAINHQGYTAFRDEE